MLSAVPKAVTEEKYGGTLFSVHPEEKEAQFCGVFSYTAHVQLSFARGTELADPDGLLKGGGKYRRHLNFKNIEDVDSKSLHRFIKSSAKL